MSNAVAPRSIAPVAIAGLLALIFFTAILPSHAAAQTVQPSNVQTGELIPPGQNTCPVITVTSIQPYVYNGVLESFDVTISDTSDGYVGILSSINNVGIPLDQITRWAGSPSGLRINVAVPDVRVGNGAQVSLTLLSSLPGQPTCLTSISFDVSGYGMNVPRYSGSGGTTVPSTSSSAAQGTPTAYPGTGSTPASTGAGTRETQSSTHTTPATSTMEGATSTAMAGAAVSSAASSKFFSSVCSGNNAYRLWFILLVIYIIIVAIVVFAEPWYLEASVIGSTATILVPLLLLLIFWYLSDSCRAASWIPVIACIIAIVGLFLAFREYEVPPLLPAASEH